MKIKNLAALKRKRSVLLKKLYSIDTFMRGSITVIHRKVGKKKYPGIFFSANIKGKTKLIYLGEKKMLAGKWLNNYKQLKILLD